MIENAITMDGGGGEFSVYNPTSVESYNYGNGFKAYGIESQPHGVIFKTNASGVNGMLGAYVVNPNGDDFSFLTTASDAYTRMSTFIYDESAHTLTVAAGGSSRYFSIISDPSIFLIF